MLDNAQTLQTKLLSVGYKQVVLVQDGAIYRVRIGPLDSDSSAHRLVNELKEEGIRSVYVVVEADAK